MRQSPKSRNRRANRDNRVAQAIQPERLEHRWLFAGITANNEVGFSTFNAVGTANTTTTIASFLTAVGGAPNGADPNPHPDGSRRIVWDGVKLDGTDFNGQTKTIVPNKVVGIPVNRFQSNGALFGEVYAVAGDGFASVNPGVAGRLTRSRRRTRSPTLTTSTLTRNSSSPAPTSSPVHEATRGFGEVFLDVERPHDSYIEYFHGDDSLGKFFVNPGPSGQPEFLGVLFNSPVVTKVEVHPGSSPLFFFNHNQTAPGEADLSNGGTEDQAAVDDFVYAEPAATSGLFLVHGTEGQTLSSQVGRFTTTNANPHASDFTATIDWGDGTHSTGTIANGATAGAFKVNGTHKYAEEGTFNISIAIHDTTGHTSTGRAVAEVADAPITAKGVNFNTSNFAPFTGTVATLSDADTAETNVNEFNALINWGDGTSTVGQLVSLGSGKFVVRGVHQYTNIGNFTVKITVDDVGGSTTTAPAPLT